MAEILFIAHRIPFPADRGDKIRSHHVLHRLAELAPVHVACFADNADEMAHEPALASLARSLCLVQRRRPLPLAGLAALAQGRPVSLTAFADARLRQYVAKVLRDRPISVIYVFSGQMGQYVPSGYAGQVIIDLVDVDSAKFGAYAETAGTAMRWLYRREDRLLSAEEARLAARADVTLLVSTEEAALLESRLPAAGRAQVRAIGMGIDTVAYDPARVAPAAALAERTAPAIIFTGQMDYPPNVAAAVRAVTRIMPQVRLALPGATFEVVGRQPTAEVRALDGQNGCRVRGAVDDIRPWLRGADLALVPLEIARGVQSKVLEAMAMTLPVVASPDAATGIAARDGAEIAVAADDAALAAAVVRLLSDPVAGRALGEAARRCVVRDHSWSAVLAPLSGMLDLAPAKSVIDVA